MTLIDVIPTDELKTILHEKHCAFNKARRAFCSKADSYSRQSVASNYNNEDEIAKLLLDCQKEKQDYLRVRDALLQRGENEFVNRSSYIRDYSTRDLSVDLRLGQNRD